jgi:oxygen-dependent protoporphyrinogen oxidase
VHLVVVGGGVAGLAAAAEARRRGARVTVLEGSSRVGGKVAVSEVGGLAVDEGADSMLTRVPDGIALARDGGLEDELVAPATGSAFVWSRGALRPLPTGTLLGLPTDLSALAGSGLLSARGLNRVPLDLLLPGRPVTDDVAVGELVTRRSAARWSTGGRARCSAASTPAGPDRLSLRRRCRSSSAACRPAPHLAARAREARSAAPPTDGPLFPRCRLPGPAAARWPAGPAPGRVGTTVRALARNATGWRLTAGSAAAPVPYDADAVVLAEPAAPAAGCSRRSRRTAAAELACRSSYASVAIVTLVLDGPVARRAGSGYLVPAVEGGPPRRSPSPPASGRTWQGSARAAGQRRPGRRDRRPAAQRRRAGRGRC